MTNKTPYEILKQRKTQFLVRELLVVPHQNGDLTIGYPFFGPNTLINNVAAMQEAYSHPQTGKRISFRESTTSESISASAYEFKTLAKPEVFDNYWLQAGRIVRGEDGVYANTQVTYEEQLRKLRGKCKKVNGIWLLENGKVKGVRDFGFAPYETFDRQKNNIPCKRFVKGGLARVLEHSYENEAQKLKVIASSDNYPKGVSIWGFEDVEKPTAMVVELYSFQYGCVDRLCIYGEGWDRDKGYAFGVLISEPRSGEPSQ